MDEVTAAFHGKQINHRRTIQAPLERKFREKQTRESFVKKSREKYESDCVRIRSYTQQITFMNGADLQKVQQKLARTQQTLQANEKDYAGYIKELMESLPAWEKEWKEFCDSCQDLEEERLDFMKDIIWAYANAISTVCVQDDEVQTTPFVQFLAQISLDRTVNASGLLLINSRPKKMLKTSQTNMVQGTRYRSRRTSSHLMGMGSQNDQGHPF